MLLAPVAEGTGVPAPILLADACGAQVLSTSAQAAGGPGALISRRLLERKLVATMREMSTLWYEARATLKLYLGAA